MNYKSKCCAKTHLPILVESVYEERLDKLKHQQSRLSQVVALWPNGTRIETTYGGYGFRKGFDEHDWASVKLVLRDAYAGESYEDLDSSPEEPRKGFFFSEAFIRAISQVRALPSHEAYLACLNQADDMDEELIASMIQRFKLQTGCKPYVTMLAMEALEDAIHHPHTSSALKRYEEVRHDADPSAQVFPLKPKDGQILCQDFWSTFRKESEERFNTMFAQYN